MASDDTATIIFSGDLLEADVSTFRDALAQGKKVIWQFHTTHEHKKLKILLDMRAFTGNYCSEAVELLTDFARENTPFVEKTASFGGSDTVKMVGETVTALAHRNNIRIFDTQEDATTWLETKDNLHT